MAYRPQIWAFVASGVRTLRPVPCRSRNAMSWRRLLEPGKVAAKARTFVSHRVWTTAVEELPRTKAAVFRATRVLYGGYLTFRKLRTLDRAAALAY